MIVIDTSIVIKAFFPEDHSSEARHLLETEETCAPDLLVYEFSNFLSRQKSIQDTDFFIDELFKLKIEFFVLPPDGFKKVTRLARTHGITSYDASFAALTQILDSELITADEKLIKVLKPHIPIRPLS